MIADMSSDKKFNPIANELFIFRDRKLNTSLGFIAQSCFGVPKDIRLNCTHYCIVEVPNKHELKQIISQNSSDISFNDIMNLYKKIPPKHIPFQLLMLLLHQIILYILEKKSCRNNIKINHDNQ